MRLTTRYWPRGGGFWVFSAGHIQENDALPEIRPSAKAAIYIGDTADEWYDAAEVLAEREFEGDTQEEVQQAVEAWAAEQYERIAIALRSAFPKAP